MNNYKSYKGFTLAEISRLGILAQQEIPNRVWNDKKLFPLPQGARNGFSKHAAFTLAEVLITLGIIGIVAAMTIPTLVANYQKKQTLVKLKQTYSILSQALTMAQVEHGDTSTWDVSGIRGGDALDPNFPKEEKLTDFSQKYLLPYMKVAKDFGYTTGSAIGYDGRYTPISGKYYNNQGYMFLLSNNVYVSVLLGGRCWEYDDDGSCIVRKFGNIVFLVDVNGFNKPNTMGKDLFYMQFDVVEKKFSMMGSDTDRTALLNTCKTDSGSQFCGQLIFIDNWQIKDDYPWY